MGFDTGIDRASACQIGSYKNSPPTPGPAKRCRRSLKSDAASDSRVRIIDVCDSASLGAKGAGGALSDRFDIFRINSADGRQRIADPNDRRVIEDNGIAGNDVAQSIAAYIA